MDWWQRDGDAGCNVTDDEGRYDPGGRCGEDATRQVLQHLALETIVIDRMCRTTRNCGWIEVKMRLRPVPMVVASRMRLRRLRKPR
jgi:hypothetical protein